METTPRHAHQSLIHRLDDFRSRVRGRLLLEGVARLAVTVVLLGLATFALDRLFRLSLPARQAMLALSGVVLGVVAWRQLVRPLRLRLGPLTLAAALDRAVNRGDGYVTSRVAALLELPEALARPKSGESLPMLTAAAERWHAELAEIPFDARLNDGRRNLATLALAAAVVAPIFFISSAPAATRLWANRLMAGSNENWPQRTYLQIAGLDATRTIVVPRGEPMVLKVSAKQGSEVPEKISIRYRQTNGAKVDGTFTLFGLNDFRYDFSSISEPITIQLFGGDDAPEPFIIRPADRPRVTALQLIAQHPTEKSPTTYNFTATDSDVSFLPLTKLQLFLTANTPVAEAHIRSSTTRPADADLHRIDDTHYSLQWTQNAAVNLQVDLTSVDAHLASAPTTVSIGLKIDQPPHVTIGFTGVRGRVTSKAKIPLTIDARDDYGLAGIALHSRTESPTTEPTKPVVKEADLSVFQNSDPAPVLQANPQHTLELEPLNLPVGAVVTVNAVATDNCYTGPQTTSSRQVTFRVVPAEELFREILLRQQFERSKFRKQSDESRKIREGLNSVNNADVAAALARQHRAVQREVTRISTSLTESLTEMQLNALGTEEAYDLMRKNVLVPLRQLNDDLLNPQKDRLDGLHPDDADALAAAIAQEDQILARMSDILRKMSQWDSFVDVLNQLNEVIKLQELAEQKTKELKKKQTDSIFDK